MEGKPYRAEMKSPCLFRRYWGKINLYRKYQP